MRNINDPGRTFTLAEAEAFAEDFPASMSDRQKRNFVNNFLTPYRAHWSDLMSQTYAPTADRASKEAEDIQRVGSKLEEKADEITDDLEAGRISAKDAARELASVNRDLKRLRQAAQTASKSEEDAWSQVDMSPAEFQLAISRRFPLLVRRGLPMLTPQILDGKTSPNF